MPSVTNTAFIPAVDDAWAVLAEPPGRRDLGAPEHCDHSLQRSQRRRACRRSRVGDLGTARVGSVLAAVVVTGSAVAGGLGAEPAAAGPRAADLNLDRGSRGPDVVSLQSALGIAADGIFGPQTERAVRRYQRNHGIEPTGHVGPQTTAALKLRSSSTKRSRTRTTEQGAPAPATSLDRAATKALQRALGVTADGQLGPQTRRAIKRYQSAHGLAVDGQPGPELLQALGVDPSAAPAPQSTPAPSGSSAVAAAQSAIGVPYASAGTTKAGFDCSGLTMWAFRQAGVKLPRTSYDQYAVGSPVSKRSIQAGDLVFFDTAGGGASHVGIATSATTAISTTTHGVMEHSIFSGYWGSHYVGARRV